MAIKIEPKSARNLRKDWKADLPPKRYRIRIDDAIEVAGNPNKLAIALGVTRSAVYQWRPPYRHDPYLPLKSAIKFLDNKTFRKKLKEIHGE
jgi:hypothetical protein